MGRALRRMIAMDASPEELNELIDSFEDAESGTDGRYGW